MSTVADSVEIELTRAYATESGEREIMPGTLEDFEDITEEDEADGELGRALLEHLPPALVELLQVIRFSCLFVARPQADAHRPHSTWSTCFGLTPRTLRVETLQNASDTLSSAQHSFRQPCLNTLLPHRPSKYRDRPRSTVALTRPAGTSFTNTIYLMTPTNQPGQHSTSSPSHSLSFFWS